MGDNNADPSLSRDASVLARMTRVAASAESAGEVAALTATQVAELCGTQALAVVQLLVTGPAMVARAGASLDPAPLAEQLAEVTSEELTDFEIPAEWRSQGVSRCEARTLPGDKTVLLLGWDQDAEPGPLADVAIITLATHMGRLSALESLSDLQVRVDNAQQLANMGDYDWHIATDTNRWSDQLYRIYGHEPGSFNASYERFLSMLHPDDREHIQGVHQQAYATGEPYKMVERVVRPDGTVRYLSSNGQVVMDANGTPVRMRGTCVDITDRVLAEQERERSAARFRSLVELAPDAVMLCDGDGLVLQANVRSAELLGGEPVGHMIGGFFPEVGEISGLGVSAIGLDGRALVLDVHTAELHDGESDDLVAVFVKDAAPRLESEQIAASFREAQVRRRQAMEINDNVVQGLTAAVYAVEQGNIPAAAVYLERTLTSARRIMSDLLDKLDGQDLQPGDLVRGVPATMEGPTPLARGSHAPAAVTPVRTRSRVGSLTRRVLIVDDSDDLRMLLRMKLDLDPGCEVVGEAADGEEAVRLAAATQPDVVLLDLSMPRMDGLEALPLLCEVAPSAQVIVLSGFDHRMMEAKALEAGAVRYVEKGAALDDLVTLIEETIGGSSSLSSD